MNSKFDPNKLPQLDRQAATVILPEKEVNRRTDLGRTTLREMIARREFPAPIELGLPRKDGRPTRIGWIEAEVEAWLQERAKRRVIWAPGKTRDLDMQLPPDSGHPSAALSLAIKTPETDA